MEAYRRQGVDLPIDLEHDSLDDEVRKHRADASDARGWFQLELRADGSLWAVNVKWTPDGSQRLANRTQRYISPAFTVDEAGRIVELINVAICAMPATHDAQALVAATQRQRGNPVVTFRAAPQIRANLYVLAARRHTTVTAVLLAAVASLNPDGPTVDAADKLRSLIEALGLAPDASRAAVLKAIGELLDAPVAGLVPSQDTPAGDPSAQGADSAPAILTASERRVWSTLKTADQRRGFLELRGRSLAQRATPTAPVQLAAIEREGAARVAQAEALLERAAQGFPDKARKFNSTLGTYQVELTPQEHIELRAAQRTVRGRGRRLVQVSVDATDQILRSCRFKSR